MFMAILLISGCKNSPRNSGQTEIGQSPIPNAASGPPDWNNQNMVRSGGTLQPGTNPPSHGGLEETLRRAHEYSAAGRSEEARQHYQMVLDQQPDHYVAHHRLAVLADTMDDFATAEKHYQLALAYSPQTPRIRSELHSDLGYSYLLQGNVQDCERNLRKSLEFNPHYKKAWNNLGLLYGKQDDYDQALEMFRRSGSSEADIQANINRLFPNGPPPGSRAYASRSNGPISTVGDSRTGAPAGSNLPQQPDSRGTFDGAPRATADSEWIQSLPTGLNDPTYGGAGAGFDNNSGQPGMADRDTRSQGQFGVSPNPGLPANPNGFAPNPGTSAGNWPMDQGYPTSPTATSDGFGQPTIPGSGTAPPTGLQGPDNRDPHWPTSDTSGSPAGGPSWGQPGQLPNGTNPAAPWNPNTTPPSGFSTSENPNSRNGPALNQLPNATTNIGDRPPWNPNVVNNSGIQQTQFQAAQSNSRNGSSNASAAASAEQQAMLAGMNAGGLFPVQTSSAAPPENRRRVITPSMEPPGSRTFVGQQIPQPRRYWGEEQPPGVHSGNASQPNSSMQNNRSSVPSTLNGTHSSRMGSQRGGPHQFGTPAYPTGTSAGDPGTSAAAPGTFSDWNESNANQYDQFMEEVRRANSGQPAAMNNVQRWGEQNRSPVSRTSGYPSGQHNVQLPQNISFPRASIPGQ